MFTAEDDFTIDNEDKKQFWIRKNAKIYSLAFKEL